MTFNFSKTCIGSVPHPQAAAITDKIIETFREMPFWPQLPRRSFLENMYAQYSERLPGVVIDKAEKKIFIDNEKDLSLEIEEALQKYLDGDTDFFSISKERAEGLYAFLGAAKKLQNPNLKFLKGHVTGPVSFGLTMKDRSSRSIIYLKEFEELIPKFLGMKAAWQARKLKSVHDKVIIFIDEPYLASLGSSYVNINKTRALEAINETVSFIKKEKALAGLHCCANTEWDFLLKSDIDILSFDAYSFMKEFLLYPEAIREFIDKGKVIAWGIVPTSQEALKTADKGSLVKKIRDAIAALAAKGIDEGKIAASSIVTPSCGLGSLGIADCDKAFALLDTVSEELKRG